MSVLFDRLTALRESLTNYLSQKRPLVLYARGIPETPSSNALHTKPPQDRRKRPGLDYGIDHETLRMTVWESDDEQLPNRIWDTNLKAWGTD